MPRASLHTLGCRLNQAETAIIAKTLSFRGYEIVEFGEPADLTVINTCTVTEQADSKCRQAVRQALRWNPLTYVAVVGCYTQINIEAIRGIKGVDLIIGNEHKLKVVDYLNGLTKQPEPIVIHSTTMPQQEFTIESTGLYSVNTRANLKIQDGCNYFCSYCIIPTVRGRARSRAFADIIREARDLVELGHRELVLTGINIGTYKNNGKRLLEVIRQLEQVDGLARIRISSIEPTTIGRELVQYMASSEKLVPHLHIPLQSGDDTILKAMKRKHSVAAFARFVEWSARTIPDIGIGTDIMVGFPGEGEAEFLNTKAALTDLPISYFHVFTYSDRPGTATHDMTSQVDYHTKKARTHRMIDLSLRKKRAFYQSHIGETLAVLFEAEENGRWTGYTGNYMRVCVSSANPLHNQILPVRFEDTDGDRLSGTLVSEEKS
jgi:threonylcarbamoyladenosine tRNA methylthiotransferase MtaB